MSSDVLMSDLHHSSSDDEDDQWIMMEMLVFQYVSTYMVKEPCRDNKLSGAEWVHELLYGHYDRPYDELRMKRHVFINLSNLMKHRGWLADSRYVRVDEQIAMFVQVLQGKGGVKRIAERFQHSLETVSKYFRIVLKAFIKLANENIRPPNFDVLPMEIKLNPKHYPYFKDCIGAIDGTHISACVPLSKQTPYRGRKGITTQNVMCVCSFDMKFTFVLAGWEGSANDCRILAEAQRNQSLGFPHPPLGKYYVVDSGFATQRGYMTPFPRVRYHLRDYRGAQGRARTTKELFNYRHSSLRNVIERTFGVLKKRFAILRSMPQYPLKYQGYIVIACCALHNFIKDEQIADEWFAGLNRFDAIAEEMEEESIARGRNGEGSSSNPPQTVSHRESANEMNNLRNQIANQMARSNGMQEI